MQPVPPYTPPQRQSRLGHRPRTRQHQCPYHHDGRSLVTRPRHDQVHPHQPPRPSYLSAPPCYPRPNENDTVPLPLQHTSLTLTSTHILPYTTSTLFFNNITHIITNTTSTLLFNTNYPTTIPCSPPTRSALAFLRGRDFSLGEISRSCLFN